MFESIIVSFQKLYFITVLVAILCIFGIWRRKGFIPSILISMLLSIGFAGSVWYIENGNWWRLGEVMEGTRSAILGFIGWFFYLALSLLLSLSKVYFSYRERRVSRRRTVGELVFWLSLLCLSYTISASLMRELPEIKYLRELSLFGALSYPLAWITLRVMRFSRKLRYWLRKVVYWCRVKLYRLTH